MIHIIVIIRSLIPTLDVNAKYVIKMSVSTIARIWNSEVYVYSFGVILSVTIRRRAGLCIITKQVCVY